MDVEPVFHALYSQPGDQGDVPDVSGAPAGRITLHLGRWPAERGVVREVGGGYDIITSKNTLKRGYIHPSRPTNPNFLVQLGVDFRVVHGVEWVLGISLLQGTYFTEVPSRVLVSDVLSVAALGLVVSLAAAIYPARRAAALDPVQGLHPD